jgi:hypothetical protein
MKMMVRYAILVNGLADEKKHKKEMNSQYGICICIHEFPPDKEMYITLIPHCQQVSCFFLWINCSFENISSLDRIWKGRRILLTECICFTTTGRGRATSTLPQ